MVVPKLPKRNPWIGYNIKKNGEYKEIRKKVFWRIDVKISYDADTLEKMEGGKMGEIDYK
jgi:hypothetical protein